MARNFNGSSDCISRSQSFFGNPLTMACWFRAENDSASQSLIGWNQAGSSAHYHTLLARGTVAGDPVSLGSVDGGALEYANTTSGYVIGTWAHACGVVISATNRKAFINGGSQGSNGVSRNPASLAELNIGSLRHVAGLGSWFDGDIAEVGIWNAALSDEEVAALGRGVIPPLIRPQSLVFYLPLVRDVLEVRGAAFTAAGTIVTDHPRILLPS